MGDALGGGAVELPSEYVGSRPIMKSVRIWERSMVLRGGELVEQWPVEGERSSTWEPFEEVTCHFPYLLEDIWTGMESQD